LADIDCSGAADLITMSACGNDLLHYVYDGVDVEALLPEFSNAYRELAGRIRQTHPRAIVIVATICQPKGLDENLQVGLAACNLEIARWAKRERFRLVDVATAFLGNEDSHLRLWIECVCVRGTDESTGKLALATIGAGILVVPVLGI